VGAGGVEPPSSSVSDPNRISPSEVEILRPNEELSKTRSSRAMAAWQWTHDPSRFVLTYTSLSGRRLLPVCCRAGLFFTSEPGGCERSGLYGYAAAARLARPEPVAGARSRVGAQGTMSAVFQFPGTALDGRRPACLANRWAEPARRSSPRTITFLLRQLASVVYRHG
jgi:hypothetical protein